MKYLLCCLALLLTACNTVQVPVQVEKTKLEIQDLQPLQLEQFKVETKLINGISYILLDVHNFTKLSNNLEKMKIYIEKQHAIINTYKDYYEKQ